MSLQETARPPRHRHAGVALALMAFGQLIITVDYNIVYVALPEIGRELGFSAQTLQWVVSAYAVTFGGFLLLGGRAADLLGRRRMFTVALLVYAVSSLVGGLVQTPELLVVARALQGIGGALLFPATLSLVNTTFAEGRDRNRALAVWGGAGASGLALGALFGGVLTNAFGWESVFLVNVPLAGGAALLSLVLIAPDGDRPAGRDFDLAGALTVTAGGTLLVFALVQGPEDGWTAPAVLTSAVLAVGLLAVFAVLEARGRDPLMPPRLLTNRRLGAAMGITFLFGGTFGVQYYLFTVYFQDVRSYSPLATGLAFLPFALLTVAGTQAGEKLVNRVGVRATLIAGMLAGAGGMVVLGLSLLADGSFLGLLPSIAVIGAGQGLAWTAMWIAAGSGVEPGSQGVAASMASTTNQLGIGIGLATVVAIVNATPGGLTDGLATAAYVTAGLSLLGFVLSALAVARPERAGQGGR